MSNDPQDPYTSEPDPRRRDRGGDPRDEYGPPVSDEAARGRVMPAAIFLIVVHVMNILASLAIAGDGLYMCLQGPDELRRKTEEGLQALPPELRDAVLKQDKQTTYNTAVAEYLGGGAVYLLLSLLALFGAIRMMSLRSYGLALTSSILAVIPCVTPCCLLGQIAGIWGLVVLMNSEVRSAFR